MLLSMERTTRRTQNRISKQRPTAGLDRINLAGETVPAQAEGQNDNRDDRARRLRALGEVVGDLLRRAHRDAP